jgi:hypothetical protein
MINNVVLEVFIGLILLFLLYSLLSSIIQEFIAQILSLRAKMLQKAIKRMLEDNKLCDVFGTHSLWKKFYNHPSIKYLSSEYLFFENKPSYISDSTFSQTMLQILRGDDYNETASQMTAIQNALDTANSYMVIFNLLKANALTAAEMEKFKKQLQALKLYNGSIEALCNDEITGIRKGSPNPKFAKKFKEAIDKIDLPILIAPDTLKQLKLLLIDSQYDVDRFRGILEKWFNDTMRRSVGWYKRQTQWILLGVGFAVSMACNVDSIKIAQILSKDKSARDGLVQMAIQTNKNFKEAPQDGADKKKQGSNNSDDENSLWKNSYKNLGNDLEQSRQVLGLGWKTGKEFGEAIFSLSILGWILTAFAISLGASFWFDLLNKIIQFRSTGQKEDVNQNKKGGGAKGQNSRNASPESITVFEKVG